MILQKSTTTIFEMADFGNFLDGGSILLKGEAKHGGAEFCQTGFFRQKASIILKAFCHGPFHWGRARSARPSEFFAQAEMQADAG